MSWMYLSFAVPGEFRGGCFVEADDLMHAARITHRLGINPGGQVVGVPCPEGNLPPPKFRGVLLSRSQLEEACGEIVSLAEMEAEERK